MDVSRFDFDLPESLIALRPAVPREAARLLVVHNTGRLQHAFVGDLPEFLQRGDALIINDSKVIPARLRGHRLERSTGGLPARVELLLHKKLGPDRWRAFARPARKLAAGDRLQLGKSIEANVLGHVSGSEIDIAFSFSGAALDEAIAREGEMPLPPYIAGKRPADERDSFDYQTMFARDPGSVAAPTAGLHFTPNLIERLHAAGISRETLTLHVGPGTFLPVTASDTAAHRMHAEWAELSAEAASRLNAVRARGGRIIPVGTTSLRTLETAAGDDGQLSAFKGETDIFITPGYRFKAADALLTNFHLPRSTLFMLVCAFAGIDTMHAAYAEAIREGYRFYSYGDACLIFPPK
ncbi:MAG TPA: tRNA preQ1(34) S-adenosylmethionine ribosyltransferase-isomerase QueA [Rhizomicrobium sp.]|nr:tRNA preQ1(34) S-adenosylmethionine ribosyltransferase-isomerase QueA [Rhizomicrobium sp.]